MFTALVLATAAISAPPRLSEYSEVRRAGDTLTLAAGQTARVTVRVPIVGTPTKYAQVLIRTSGWAGVADVLPMGEITKTHRKPTAVDVAVLVSANIATTAKPGALRIVVNDPNIGRTVGEKTWRPKLIVSAAADVSAPVQRLQDDLKQARAGLNSAIAKAGPAAKSLRSTGMAMLGPATAQWLEPLTKVLRYAGRRQALAARLRAVALADSGPNGAAALGALARHRSSSQRPADRLLERIPPGRAVKRTAALLSRLQLEQTMGWVDALVDSGRLQRAQLGQALVLRATVLGLGGFDEEARLAFGQGSCLDPVARPPNRPAFEEVFQRLGRPPGCRQPVNILGASAVRVPGDDGVAIKVLIRYGPDPFSLIVGGNVRVFDGQGGLIAERTAAPEIIEGQPADQRTLVAEVFDDGNVADPAGQIYVAAGLEGPGRVAVAELGVPEPQPLTLEEPSSFSGGGWPWWLWATLGVVAVGGITAAAVVATSDDTASADAPRGIGPIDIRF